MKSIMCILAAGVMMLGTAVLAQDDSTPPTPPPDTQAAEVAETTEAPAPASDNVKRSVFTTSVVDREPVDELSAIPVDASKICFFTEIVNLTGTSITHRWINGGETMAEVTFDIGGPRWRVYSIKTLPPDRTGPWTVEIVDDAGNMLQRAEVAHNSQPEAPAPVEEQTTQDG